MAQMHVELVAPDREVWSGDAEMVIARTAEGEIGVMAGHQPLLGVLVEGTVRIKRSGESELVAAVHGGFLSVSDRGVAVLGELVELAEEIDTSRARQALDRARGSEEEEARAAARRAEARLRAAGQPA